MSIGERILLAARMKIPAMTPGERMSRLAEKTGINLESMYDYMHDFQTPNSTELLKIADATGQEIDFFFPRPGEEGVTP